MSDVSKHAVHEGNVVFLSLEIGQRVTRSMLEEACQRAIDSARPEIVAEATAELRGQINLLRHQCCYCGELIKFEIEKGQHEDGRVFHGKCDPLDSRTQAELRAEVERLAKERDDMANVVARTQHGATGMCCQLRLREKDRAETAERRVEELTKWVLSNGIEASDETELKVWTMIFFKLKSLTRKEGEPCAHNTELAVNAPNADSGESSTNETCASSAPSEVQPLDGGAEETPEGLHTNPDARAWAAYFMVVKARVPSIADDEGTMIGWFANAMMAMHDSQVPKRDARIAELQGQLVQAKNECTARASTEEYARNQYLRLQNDNRELSIKNKERDTLREQLSHQKEMTLTACKYWTGDDTKIKALCKPFGIDTEGDSYGVPLMVDCVEELAKKLTEAQSKLAKVGPLVDALRQIPSTFGMVNSEAWQRALAFVRVFQPDYEL